jgi:RecB family exonuclease/plasmid stabilization system protein ParE
MNLAEAVLEARRASPSVHVICRNGAARRRALADLLGSETGWDGVRVMTLNGLIREFGSRDLLPLRRVPESVPEGHPWAERFRDSPHLRRLLREHVGRAHRIRAVGGDLSGLPGPLAALVDVGWGIPDDLDGWTAVLASPPSAVVPVGFVEDDQMSFGGILDKASRLLQKALGLVGDSIAEYEGPIAARRVPDVVAEARTAAVELRDAERGLILVSDVATADRVTAALHRNGIAVARDGSAAFDRHALAALLLRLRPLFEANGEATITNTDLFHLLAHPLLSKRARKDDLDSIAGWGGDRTSRASVRHIRQVLVSTCRFRATPGEWVRILEDAAARAQAPTVRDDGTTEEPRPAQVISAFIALGRVRLLAECAARGTLEAMADLISGFGVSATDDLAQAIRTELRRAGQVPATLEAVEEMLAGAIDEGQLPARVSVLHYEEYDGRAADVLVLLDVHHKGLGQATAPDPLLGDDGCRALGLPTPECSVRERLRIARWAATRAGRAVAVVTSFDASSRAVVPPVGLTLDFQDEPAGSDSYGFSLPLPETADRAVLRGPGDDSCLAAQLDAEWVRAGFRLDGASMTEMLAEPARATLAERLGAEDVRPPGLRPWLGRVGPAQGSDDGLPPSFVISASRLQAFTSCMYKAWVESVLRLKEPDPLEEDVGAKDIGRAAHRVLETCVAARAGGVRWVVPDDQVEAERAALATAASAAMDDAVRETRERRGAHEETPAAEAARVGLTERWKRHWPGYASGRVLGVETVSSSQSSNLSRRLASKADKRTAFALCPDLSSFAAENVDRALRQALARCPTTDGLRASVDAVCEAAPKKNQAAVREALARDLPQQVLDLIDAAAREWTAPPHPDGDGTVIASEASFDPPAALLLSRSLVPVRGSIDAIVKWRTVDDTPELEVRDFKTGGATSGGTKEEVLQTFTRPQLAFYALAVRSGLVTGAEGLPVRRLGYDMVRTKEPTNMMIDGEALDRAAETFGELLDRARDGDYPLAPHPTACPLTGSGFCDYLEVCRLRTVPPPPTEDKEDEDES